MSTIFDYLNAINSKIDIPYDKKEAPCYLISLWLSHDNTLLDIINNINNYHFLLDDKIIYKYYFDKIPKGRRFLKWVKKEVSEKDAGEKELREELDMSKTEYSKYKMVIDKINENKPKETKGRKKK